MRKPGRFFEQLAIDFPKELNEVAARYNIAPSQAVIGAVGDPHLRPDVMEWGFVPSWAREESRFKPVINARAETLVSKPYFKGAFRSNRCVILADGFYEWLRTDGQRLPFRITRSDGEIFAMAGLRSERIVSDGSERITCAIITTDANERVGAIHTRMPVMLPLEHVADWLDRSTPQQELIAMLAPWPGEKTTVYRVSTVVNNPRNDAPECIEPLGETPS